MSGEDRHRYCGGYYEAHTCDEIDSLELRADRAEEQVQRVRELPEKESDVGYPNDWHMGWNACRDAALDALDGDA